jgi:hypothetical protein
MMRRAVLVLAFVAAAVGVGLAVAPFARPDWVSGLARSHLGGTCRPPIVSSWETEHISEFTVIAPTANFAPFRPPYCRPEARTRIAISGGLWFGAAIAVFALRRRSRPTPQLAAA